MKRRQVFAIGRLPYLAALVVMGGVAMWRWAPAAPAPASFPPPAAQAQPGEIAAAAVGHEFREDDWPSIAAAPDGSIWVAWLSFSGDRDDVAIRRWRHGKWGNLHWVPATSGDSWMPQVASDSSGRPWVVWSQQVQGNWDLYGRRFDPAAQEWGPLERLTTDPLPDINPRIWSDRRGKAVLVWQGFRGRNSSIFLRRLEGGGWQREVRVTSRAANDWEPAVAVDSRGTAWVAYDSYKNGDYDVFLTSVHGNEPGAEVAVAATPRFEARATVAVDISDRVWVAWEAGFPGWGKDNGAVLRDRAPGVRLGLQREPRVRCYQNGRWLDPRAPVAALFRDGWTNHPHVFADGRGSVWLAAKTRRVGGGRIQRGAGSYYEYRITRLEGDRWRPLLALPRSKGRLSTRLTATLAPGGELWVAWPTDNRTEAFYHRPVRHQVWAGSVGTPPPAPEPVWGPAPEEQVEIKPGHRDEPGDVAFLRAYTTRVDGRQVHLYRGDFHRHTEFSWDGGGGGDGAVPDAYRYMLDVAALDFGASTDHQGGGHPTWWWYSQKLADMHNVPGAYVSVFGYERSAGWPHSHRNMFFARRSEARVTPFFLRDGARGYGLPLNPEGDEPGIATGELVANDTKLLYEELRGRDAIAIAHTTGTTGGTDWRDNDPDLEPVVEIYQGARTSYEMPGGPHVMDRAGLAALARRQGGAAPTERQIEEAMARMDKGMVSSAWAKGYRLGVISSSDHGSTHISYAMVYTDNPTRAGILEAMRKRHTYGAMDNILLDVRMGDRFMGDEFALQRPAPLRVYARGTGAVAKVDVIKDSRVIYSASPNTAEVRFAFTDRDGGAGRHYYYVRLMQEDGMVAWSSPFFVTYPGAVARGH